MRQIFQRLGMIFCFMMVLTPASAQTTTIEVTVSYRERIMLPPNAVLRLQLLDVSRADAAAKPLASQLYRMTGVPMPVSLQYDAALITEDGVYSVDASISSDGAPLFRSAERYDPFRNTENKPSTLFLTAAEASDATAPMLRRISGVEWAVTEIAGAPWPNDDPATLIIDDAMSFSIFGGCNRFVGQLVRLDREIAFPRDFAGTMMACPDEVENVERALLDALMRASGYVRYSNGLVIMDADSVALLHFALRPE